MKYILFAENLKKYRTQKGLSQKALSELVSNDLGTSLTTSSISNYENKTSEPDLKKLVSISKILEISIDKLLGITQNYSGENRGKSRGKNWGNQEAVLNDPENGYGTSMINLISDSNWKYYDGDQSIDANYQKLFLPNFADGYRFRAFEVPDNSLLREDESGLARHDIIICERVSIPEERINAVLSVFNGLLIGRITTRGNQVIVNPDNESGNYPSWTLNKSDIVESWAFRALITRSESATRTKSSKINQLESTLNDILKKMS